MKRPWLILAGLPLLLLALNRAWIFTAPGIDAWIYYGYYFNFPEYIQHFPEAYFSSRFSLILAGYATHNLLPPLAANYALHLGLYYLAVACLYDTLRLTTNPPTPLLGAILMGAYLPFLTAVGWNYIDGFGIAYLLLTIWALTRTLHSPAWRRWLFLSGLACGFALHSNLILILFTPFLGLYYLLGQGKKPTFAAVIQSIALAVAGVVSITILLGLISLALGGEFAFFEPSLSFMLNRSNESGNFAGRHGDGLRAGHHLALTFATSVGAMLWIWQKRRITRENRFDWLWVAGGGLVTIVYFLIEIFTYPVMSLQYYGNYLLPFVFLSLSVQLFTPLADFSHRRWAIWAGLLVGINSLGLWLVPWRELVLNYSQVGNGVILSLLLITLAILAVYARPRHILAWLFFCLMLSAVGYRTIAKPAYTYNPPNDLTQTHEDFMLAVYDGIQAAQTYTADEPMYMWFTNEPNTPFYAIVSAHVNPNSFIGQPFAGIYPTTRLYAGQRIAILSFDGQVWTPARDELLKHAFKPQLLGEERLFYGDMPFVMTFIELQPCGLPLPPVNANRLYGVRPTDRIFYPATDRQTLLETLPADHDCWIDEAERADHAEMGTVLSWTQDEMTLGGDYTAAISAWRADKAPVHLAEVGLEYLFVSDDWRSWLSPEEIAVLDDPAQYELLHQWIFYRAEKSYWLYRVVAD